MKKSLLIIFAVIFIAAACNNQSSIDTDIKSFETEESTPIKVQGNFKSSCDPNYSGCVPIASDVDCAGGSGNGPAYVRGPVSVIGSDIYGLDRDGDGLGCE